MKKLIVAFALLAAIAGFSQPAPVPGLPPGAPAVAAKEAINYLVRVEWSEPKGEPKFLEVLTAAGNFNLNTVQKNSVKINNNDVPTTLKFEGTINPLDENKGRLQLFLGRTIPFITGTSGGSSPTSTYSQMSVGLNSTFVVTFDKPLVVQNDENGQVTVLVKRLAD